MTRIAISGAGGRMGRALIQAVAAQEGATLAALAGFVGATATASPPAAADWHAYGGPGGAGGPGDEDEGEDGDFGGDEELDDGGDGE